MKRDMDLVRKILMRVEESNEPFGLRSVVIDGVPSSVVGYHVEIMQQADLVEAGEATHMGSEGREWHSVKLTWVGHEFLDAARSDTVWNKAKRRIGETVGTVTFDVLKTVLVMYAKQQLGVGGQDVA